MWATILAIIASLLSLLSKAAAGVQEAAQKKAGADEVLARDAAAEADAARKAEAVATEGQTNAQTLDDLRRGDF